MSRRETGSPEVLRFIIVGLGNTIFSYCVYVLLLYVGFGFAVANLLALLLGIAVSFTTQGRWVFGNTDRRRFGRFVLSWMLIYCVGIAIIDVLVASGFSAYSGGALALPFTSALSYCAQKYFVYRLSPGDETQS